MMRRRRVVSVLCVLASVIWLSVTTAQIPTQVYLPSLADPRPSPTTTPTLAATPTHTATPTITPTPDPIAASLPNGNFEQGNTIWETSSVQITLGTSLPLPPRSGQYAALVRFEPGFDATIGILVQEVTVPNEPVDLVFYYQLRTTEAICGGQFTSSTIRLESTGDTPGFEVPACAQNVTTSWRRVAIDYSADAGKTIILNLRADLFTDGAYVMFDDVGFVRRP